MTVQNLKAGTIYVFQVRARTVAGYGRFSGKMYFQTMTEGKSQEDAFLGQAVVWLIFITACSRGQGENLCPGNTRVKQVGCTWVPSLSFVGLGQSIWKENSWKMQLTAPGSLKCRQFLLYCSWQSVKFWLKSSTYTVKNVQGPIEQN